MVNVNNITLEEYYTIIKNKRVIAFGIGRFFEMEFFKLKLDESIECAIDNDIDKLGIKCIGGITFDVNNKKYLESVDMTSKCLIITSSLTIRPILELLDSIDNLDGVDCFIATLLYEKYVDRTIKFGCSERNRIPKIIHYCWFGNSRVPENLLKYISSWREKCPDYEIKLWNETNYDISKNQYMKEAYEKKKWGFVPDYARLDIVYQFGGIYLDTDVQIIQNFDDLLYSESFFGASDNSGRISLGLGFGAVKGNKLIKDMRDYYDGISFIKNNGEMDLRPCNVYQMPIFEKWTFELKGYQENIAGNVIYPMEVFNPLGRYGLVKNITDKTHSIHRQQLSWESQQNREQFCGTFEYLKNRINNNYT